MLLNFIGIVYPEEQRAHLYVISILDCCSGEMVCGDTNPCSEHIANPDTALVEKQTGGMSTYSGRTEEIILQIGVFII